MGYATDEYEFKEMIENDRWSKKILIEGDSWVSHPLLNHLGKQFDMLGMNNLNILNLSSPGDMSLYILDRHGRQYKRLKELISDSRLSHKWDMIFLSAAGNDIVGPEVRYYVDDKKENSNKYGRQLLNAAFYKVIDQIKKDYEMFLSMRDQSQNNSTTPVITHVYSYLAPRPVGTHFFKWMFDEGWISIYLDDKGIIDQAEKNDIAVGMLDAFYDALSSINANYFLVVDTRTILSNNGRPDIDQFYDEIHPKSDGFKKVAKTIIYEAKAKNYWPG